MMWPGNSPDMNIIETVWGPIMDRLRNEPPLTIAELRQRVHQHCGEVTPQYLRSLYTGLPRRVAALHRARGYPTKYWGNMYQEISYLAAQLWTMFSINSVHRKCRWNITGVVFVITSYDVIIYVIILQVAYYPMLFLHVQLLYSNLRQESFTFKTCLQNRRQTSEMVILIKLSIIMQSVK